MDRNSNEAISFDCESELHEDTVATYDYNLAVEAETEFGQDHNSQNANGVHPFIGDLSGLMIQVESHMNKYSAPIIIKLFQGRDKYYRQYSDNKDKYKILSPMSVQ